MKPSRPMPIVLYVLPASFLQAGLDSVLNGSVILKAYNMITPKMRRRHFNCLSISRTILA